MVEITSVAILIAFVMGGTELVKQAFDKNWRVVAIIVVAVLIGGLTMLPQQAWWRQAWLAPPLETAVLASKPWLPAAVAKRIRYR